MEIIPNWHPIFVHFTIALFSVSALLYLAGSAFKKENLLIAARWNLWIGAVVTVGTVLAGFDAYNTVGHDAASHAAMTEHRNWALPTAGIFMATAVTAAMRTALCLGITKRKKYKKIMAMTTAVMSIKDKGL